LICWLTGFYLGFIAAVWKIVGNADQHCSKHPHLHPQPASGDYVLPQWRSNVEIIVIDSASEPPARETLAQLLAENPHIQTHRLERPGLSLARNAAVSLSKGSWLAFLDDDAAPDPEWVSEIVALLKRLPPRTGTVGLYTSVLIGLSILDSPQGTKVARAMWHFGIVRAYFMRQAPLAASMDIVANPGGGELLALAAQSENELPDQR
jgi:glycosyltransferase involved in cell wall biosynthesis